MDQRKDGNRTIRRRSSDKSRPSQENLRPKPTPSPTFLTSFPSLSPPELTRSKKKAASAPTNSGNERTESATERGTGYLSINKFRAVSSPAGTKKQANTQNTGASAMNRTVQAATNLRKTIIDTMTFRSTSQASPGKIFHGEDEGTGDPLAGASDDQVLKIINSSGGPVATIKKYSADLAETNERVTSERNSKLRLVEENRQLRAQMQDKGKEIEELGQQLATAKDLFSRYVAKMQAELSAHPQVQILESPTGPYALEDSSGTILATLNDDFVFPDGSSFGTSIESSIDEDLRKVERGKSMDTIRPKRHSKPPKLPQRLVSSIKAEAVEMKSPVDVEMLPPALRDASTPSEALVDRLGFYITPDREKRYQEASSIPSEDTSESSSINSGQKDDDESFISTNELLCDAPVTPAARLIFRSESSSRIFIEVDKTTQPTENTGFTSPVTATHVSGGIAPTSATSSLSAMLNPIQDSKALSSLLVKLNQAYDLQQKRRTKAWANFYEQTRELLQKSSKEPLDENNIAGVMALCSASHVSSDIRLTLNNLIRRGVPVTFRREVWLERSGANNIRDPEHYHSLIQNGLDDALALKEITVDVERTLSNNLFFREGVGKSRLHDVLIAFAAQNPSIGYSQGLNIIAANLLLMVPAPEDGFALLEVLVKDILPSDYYARDGAVSGVILERDGQVISSYVAELFPTLHKHLAAKGAPLTMFTPGWFISAFAACVNGEALYRLWDLVFGFCDGRFVFCFALALLRLNRRGLLACRDAEELMSYLGGRMSMAAVSLDALIGETWRMSERVTAADLKKRRESFERY